MSKSTITFARLLGSFLLPAACGSASGVVNNWTNPASANWEESFWSLGVLPDSAQSVTITNSGYKAVGIFPTTPVNFPDSMSISNLTISAPPSAISVLLLNYAGTAVPLRVSNACVVASNGVLENLYSAFQVDSGEFDLISGKLIQEGGATVATNGLTSVFGGTANLTNASIHLGPLVVDGPDSPNANPGAVTQAGGVAICDLSIRNGSYNLLAGSLYGTTSLSGPSTAYFTQVGGTNFGPISLGSSPQFNGGNFGTYTLYAGAVTAPALSLGPVLYSGGQFSQIGGFVSVASLALGSVSFRSFPGQGFYSLTNGVLVTGTIDMLNGYITQAGGQHTISNGLSLFGNFDDYGSDNRFVSYSLSGGSLVCPSINIGLFGSFGQSGGTNTVAGDLVFVNTSYTMSGGSLLTSNTIVSFGYFTTSDGYHFHTQFLQSGGQHRVSNTLSNLDQYLLSGGSLFANRIYLRGLLAVSNVSAAISNPGGLDFGGTLRLYDGSSETLGPMLLSADSVLDLPGTTHMAAFSNSSSLGWSNGVTLTVTNWNGSTNGGGPDRLIFGNSAAALTPTQLGHIQFVSPAGFLPGTYPARILSTGEVVPTIPPSLVSLRSGNNLVLTWVGGLVLQSSTNVQGPYMDVPGASSPFTTTTTQIPTRFFRLRQ